VRRCTLFFGGRARLPLHRSTPALPDAADERAALLRDLVGGIGKATVIRPLFHCDADNIRRGRGRSPVGSTETIAGGLCDG
jgi:hypothetical protein